MNLNRNVSDNTKSSTAGSNSSDAEQRPRDGSIRKRNIAEFYNVELSDKKSSRKAISQTTEEMAASLYSKYEL